MGPNPQMAGVLVTGRDLDTEPDMPRDRGGTMRGQKTAHGTSECRVYKGAAVPTEARRGPE